jgi:peptide/nickel transport system ATP-binding protein
MEIGESMAVFSPPYHPYTHILIMAVPSLERAGERRMIDRLTAKPASTAQACAFAGRCPWQPGVICERETPPWRQVGTDKEIRCHLPLNELAVLQKFTSGMPPIAPVTRAGDKASGDGMPI